MNIDPPWSDEPPWPAAAAGFGPSLVLARPTYGEADPRAWSASTRAGGSPGTNDPAPAGPLESVAFSEVLARPAFSEPAFIELHNRGAVSADLSGCRVWCASATNRFSIPAGTILPPGGFVAYPLAQLPFALRGDGGTLALSTPDEVRILDLFPVRTEEPGISVGRFPEGVEKVRSLDHPTPGGRNAGLLMRPVSINEILYHPPVQASGGEFIELFNSGLAPVDLGGWRLSDGIEYPFPPGTAIPPQGFVVVAANPALFTAAHGDIAPSLLLGPYRGSLSHGGERVALLKPSLIDAGGTGRIAWVAVDEVVYGTGGAWGKWSDGGGSSLELVNPRSDHLEPASWADSDESAKAPWSTVEFTGYNDQVHPSTPTSDQVQVILWGAGEMLLDNFEVLVNGQNRVKNPFFETNSLSWGGQGTHRGTFWETNSGYNSPHSLHVVAMDRGDNDVNRVHGTLTPSVPTNSIVTLRAQARWLAGTPDLLIRLRGGGIEAPGRLPIPANLGTPGRPNSRRVANPGPSITEVSHFPILPPTNQAIRVTARILDPDGVGAVLLRYRIDPTNTLFTIPMVDDGTGADAVAGDHLYTAEIPGQRKGKMVAFRVEAVDLRGGGVPGSSVFPLGAPRHECLVRVGDTNLLGGFATYRMWITQSNVTYWSNREKMSNEPLDITFVYGGDRVVYGAGSHYSGSNYTVGGYDSPTGALCGYDLFFPADAPLLGDEHWVLDWPIRDDTDQREQLMFWFLEQYGLPNHYRRYVNLFVNGIQRGTIYDDVQQPDSNGLREWFPSDSQGVLLKTDCWDEFLDSGDAVAGLNCVLNTLERFVAPDGSKKTSRYRWNWRPRAAGGLATEYDDFFTLVDAVNYPTDRGFVEAVQSVVDVEHWMRTFAMNDLASYWDGFGNVNAKNTYLYKPARSGWKLISWDFDVGLGINFNDEPTRPLFGDVLDPELVRIYASPQLLRPYWVAMDEAVNSFFKAGPGTAVEAIINSKYAAFKTNRIALAEPSAIRDWMIQRRAYITNQLRAVAAPFALTTPATQQSESPDGVVSLAGTAPANLQSIRVNGRPQPITWTTVTNWSFSLGLQPGENTVVIDGLDRRGGAVAGSPLSLGIQYTGAREAAEGNLRITELQFRPMVPGSEYVEIHNAATLTTFDLSGWRLDGVRFVFPDGTLIRPGEYLLVVGNRAVFGQTYGWDLPVAGEFPGTLSARGELISLVEPGGVLGGDRVLDQAYYEPGAPSYAGDASGGMSIERAGGGADGLRTGNWTSSPGSLPTDPVTLLSVTDRWRYEDSGGDPGTAWRAPGFDDSAWASGAGGFYATTNPLPFPKSTLLQMTNSVAGRRVVTHYLRTTFLAPPPSEGARIRLQPSYDDGVVIYLNGEELLRRRMPATPVGPGTLASADVPNALLEAPFEFPATRLLPGTNSLAVEVHQSKTNSTDMAFAASLVWVPSPLAGGTPGASNPLVADLPPVPDLWLSEVQAENIAGPVDAAGRHSPWVELYNAGSDPVSLGGLYLSGDVADPWRWRFPDNATLGAGEFRLIWLDGGSGAGITTELHASFEIPPRQGGVFLSRPAGGGGVQWIDYLLYEGLPAGRSYGKFPAGSPLEPRVFVVSTPGLMNSDATGPVSVWINEWMAANTRTVADPADGQYDDWFELYNAGAAPVDLSGFSLTGNLSIPGAFRIPPGFVIPGGGFLRVWADSQTGESRPGGDLHVNFKLSAKGDSIGLFAPDGTRIDAALEAAVAARGDRFVALTFDPRESDLTPIAERALVTAFPSGRARVLRPGDDLAVRVREARNGRELWREFVLLALLLLVAEAILGRWGMTGAARRPE